ncbi:acyl carrier protein [Amycolatopsis keratiniphila]|uniref:Polyketide synthase chain carrier protein n=1 Tax=Amycolatopsis keratiniphila TaxID=129921 RepID=R4TCC2_9PSEU|nr:acyl carrier protein [Amycolatopsis keratiniphila]AGM08088.1 polyketide synthase chain carrier protein [Amycolatopsis keratiniphila]
MSIEQNGLQQIDEEKLREWLVSQAAKYAKLDDAEIDADTPLSQYGLDSVSAVALAVDLEDEFGIVLGVDTLWKYPTVNLVVEMLLSTPRRSQRD